MEAARVCLKDQLVLQNPMWDAATGMPKRGDVDDYEVVISDNEDLPILGVKLLVINVYPDAPLSFCTLDAQTLEVLQIGWEVDSNEKKTIVKKYVDLFEGLTEQQIKSIVARTKQRRIPLRDLNGP